MDAMHEAFRLRLGDRSEFPFRDEEPGDSKGAAIGVNSDRSELGLKGVELANLAMSEQFGIRYLLSNIKRIRSVSA